MNYAIELDPEVIKYLNKQGKTQRNRLLDYIHLLAENPRSQELRISRLKGFQNLYRVRIGSYSIIYKIFDNKLLVYIIRIGPRGDVYKKL